MLVCMHACLCMYSVRARARERARAMGDGGMGLPAKPRAVAMEKGMANCVFSTFDL